MNDVKYPELAGKFRKKPVVIDAWCIDFNNTPYPEWVELAFNKDETEACAIDWCPSGEGLYINTLEGHMQAAVGDFLIRGVAGELYACRADIFAATYEAAHIAGATCALRGAQKESGWLPIETAPDETPVWLVDAEGAVWIGERAYVGEDGGWLWGNCYMAVYQRGDCSWASSSNEIDDDYQPIAWQPLPSPPTPEGEAK